MKVRLPIPTEQLRLDYSALATEFSLYGPAP